MHVAESGRHREIGTNRVESLVGFGDFLGLSVEARFIDAGIIHPIFFTAGHTELDLERHAQLAHARKILCARLDVLLQRFLGKIEHVRAIKRLSRFGELLFARCQQAINPGQKLLGAMVGI